MLRSITASITAIALLSPVNVLANHCVSPFSSNVTAFQLFEQLDCSKATFPVVLNIIPANQKSVTGKWNPKCLEQAPYFELLANSVVVAESGTMANTLAKEVSVLSCDGKVIFNVNRTPVVMDLASGEKVYVSTRVFSIDGTLIGYVTVSDDGTNGVVLRGPDSTILAQGTKVFSGCSATWTVANSAQTVQIANVISFLITLKDNDGFSCVSTAPVVTGPSYGMFALGVAVGAVGLGLLEFGVWFGYRAYQRSLRNRAEATSLVER